MPKHFSDDHNNDLSSSKMFGDNHIHVWEKEVQQTLSFLDVENKRHMSPKTSTNNHILLFIIFYIFCNIFFLYECCVPSEVT